EHCAVPPSTAPGTPKPPTEKPSTRHTCQRTEKRKTHLFPDTAPGSSPPKSRSWTVTTSAPNRKGLTADPTTTQGKTTATLVPLTPLLVPTIVTLILLSPLLITIAIGRASCRERVRV